jgi:hypothetical protein
VRVSLQHAGLLAALGLLLLVPPALAQNPELYDPDKNAAKAKQLLHDAIAALGDAAYKDYDELQCEGRLAQFEHSGGLAGYANYRNFWHFPDKNRTEFVVTSTNKASFLGVLIGSLPMPVKGGVFIQVFSGNEGWTMDKSGVNEAPATSVSDFQASAKHNIRNVLLIMVKQPDVFLHYGGSATADLRPVDWLEITDPSEEGSIRVAFDQSTHLPSRMVVTAKDPVTGEMDDDVTIFSNYQPSDGVQTPMQLTRLHNDRRVSQLFYSSCKANPNLPADFFTKEGLEKHYKETGGKIKPQK